jgi:hypothetical protein
MDVCREGPQADLLDLGGVDEVGVGVDPFGGGDGGVVGEGGVGKDVECA